MSAYTIYSVLAGDGSPKDKVAGVAGALGGLGGGTLGATIGATLGSVVPLAGTFIGGILGGGLGFFVGDSVAKGLAQWLLGVPVDAFPDKINDMINGSGGGEASAGGAAKIGGGAGGETKPPMTKNQFLQSERYKSQMRDESGVVRGESTAGKQMAYEEYLKEQSNPEVQKNTTKIKKDLKGFKGNYGKQWLRSPKGKKKIAKINRFIDNNLNGDAILANLEQDDLIILGRTKKAKVHVSDAIMKKSTGLSGSDDFTYLGASVSPSHKTAALGAIHSENATLKGQETGSSNLLNAPSTNVTTNNNGTTLLMPNTAQGGMKLDKLVE